MHTVEVTVQNFVSTIEKPGIVLLDWWAAWCGPCRMFAPVFEAAAGQHKDIVFGKVDTEAQQELGAAFNVRAIPTLMAFRDGILVFSQAGALPGKAVEELITKIQALDMDEVRGKVAEARKEYEKAQKDDNASTDEQPAQSA